MTPLARLREGARLRNFFGLDKIQEVHVMRDFDTNEQRVIDAATAERLRAAGHRLAGDPSPFTQVVEVPHEVYQREAHRIDEKTRQERKAHRKLVEASRRRNRTRRKH